MADVREEKISSSPPLFDFLDNTLKLVFPLVKAPLNLSRVSSEICRIRFYHITTAIY